MLLNIGVQHQRVPLSILDALTLRDPEEFYRILRTHPKIKGSLILQTCNRVEIYLDSDDPEKVSDEILWHWALETKFKLGELTRLAETRSKGAVVDHLVRLASGFESMLVGEPQILGQLRTALAEARSLKAANETVTELFEKAIQAGSRIREQTGIGKGAVSLGSAVIKLAEESLGSIQDARILLIGTGQVGMLLMKALKARGVNRVLVSGRTIGRVQAFCRTYGGTPIGFRQVSEQLGQTDLVIVATKSRSYLLTEENLRQALAQRKAKLAIVDVSSPRNVSPDVGKVEGVTLKTIEDLRSVTDEARTRRREIVKRAEPLVREKVKTITGLLRRENAEPIVSDIYRRADNIRARELERAVSRLGLNPEQEKIVRNMSVSMVEKILAPPVGNLRRAAEKGETELLTVAAEIFGSN